jgi:hypothetical protein
MIITIYVLKDPDTMEIRYVGVTSQTLNRRLSVHINKSPNLKTHVARWITKLLNNGKEPIIEEIEHNETDTIVWGREQEEYWIAEYRKQGKRLCNHLSGGYGQHPPKPSGWKMDDANKAQIAEKVKARWNDPKYRNKVIAGKIRMWGNPIKVAKWYLKRKHYNITPDNIEYAIVCLKERDILKRIKPMINTVVKNTLKKIKGQDKDNRFKRQDIVPLTYKGSAFIHLSKGKHAIIDTEDWDKIKDYLWHASINGISYRAKTTVVINGVQTKRTLKNYIVGSKYIRVSGNPLDCRKQHFVKGAVALRHNNPADF